MDIIYLQFSDDDFYRILKVFDGYIKIKCLKAECAIECRPSWSKFDKYLEQSQVKVTWKLRNNLTLTGNKNSAYMYR